MRSMTYTEYFDKVYGCFLGKCIGGTAGGPAEGRKELLDAPLNEELLHSVLPNDDLDLQIMWLELLEEKGVHISARDMAKDFLEKVHYGPGEYAYFKKNCACGIYPPTSGRFNNDYYENGMGCPIRSEIWACLFPGMPRLAEPYVRMDGSLDHVSDSIDAESFMVYLESEMFFAHSYEELNGVLARAMETLPEDSKIARVLKDTVRWYREGRDWKNTRGMILRHYGHADCTNLYENMGFVLLSLLYGKGDFRETIRLGLACGYDTDCICASAASVLGILMGAEAILAQGLQDTGLNVEIRTRRRECSVRELAQDVCAAGMSMECHFAVETQITEKPDFKLLPESCVPEFDVEVSYTREPVLYPDRKTEMVMTIKGTGKALVRITPPEGVEISPQEFEVDGSTAQVLSAWVRPDATVIHKANLFKVQVGNTETDFGLMGCVVWKRYGPFLMNNCDLSAVAPHLPYGTYIQDPDPVKRRDMIRDYHLNCFADIDRAFVDETAPFTAISNDGSAEREAETVYTGKDLFSLSEIQSFRGPHIDYLVTTWVSPEEREVELAVGHTAPFKLWINGELVGQSKDSTWWTAENKHIFVKLRQGENTVILKCAQVSTDAGYSLIPRIFHGGMSQHHDIDCKLQI